MQAKMTRNRQARAEATRKALLDAAYALFTEHGYAGTSTPEICALAGITRGALYHHFADKQDLFRAVLEREAKFVADEIRRLAPDTLDGREALAAGSIAYLDAMARPGRTRLLLVEGPTVLGADEAAAIDARNAAATLEAGLDNAIEDPGVDIASLARLVSAAFDRAALEIDGGRGIDETREAMLWLLGRILDDPRRRRASGR